MTETYYLNFHNIIQSLWEQEFNYCKEERYSNKKEEIINIFIKRLKFCDKYKPKINGFTEMTPEIAIKIQYMDRLRLVIIKDMEDTQPESVKIAVEQRVGLEL
jgi:hypothetical protein